MPTKDNTKSRRAGSGLCLTLKYGDLVKIGESIVVVKKRGTKIRMVIDSPDEIKINRIGRINDITGDIELYGETD